MNGDWLIWQLADSAFPSGGFAHSGGLEAAWRHGSVNGADSLADFIRSGLAQVGRSQIPFVNAAHDQSDRFVELDHLWEACTRNHVAHRASVTQGLALLNTIEAAFDAPQAGAWRLSVMRGEAHGHLPVVFGVVTATLGVSRDCAARLYLFLALRSLTSSAVRLGIVGPQQAQAVQYRLGSDAERVARQCLGLTPDDMAISAPLIDLFQATQDRLYTRLFQS